MILTSFRLGLLILLLGGEGLFAGSREPAPNPVPPAKNPIALVPETQIDAFSCGFHALSSIYRSHGVDPRLANLRDRLGTSVPAIPFVQDSTGTLQPDLFRVLHQDGFDTLVLNPTDAATPSAITTHLEKGLYVLALTETARAGGLHWVVFTHHGDGQITIADSLHRELRQEPLEKMLSGPLLSAILITPGTPDPNAAYGRLQAHGLGEMVVTFARSAPLWVTILLLCFLVLVTWFSLRVLRAVTRKIFSR